MLVFSMRMSRRICRSLPLKEMHLGGLVQASFVDVLRPYKHWRGYGPQPISRTTDKLRTLNATDDRSESSH